MIASNCFFSDEVVNVFGCFDFCDPGHCETRILSSRACFCSEIRSPALKIRVVREFPQIHLWYWITMRTCHATLSTSLNTRNMVIRHGHWTISIVTTSNYCSSLKRRHKYCLQWFSTLCSFTRVLPNFLNCSVLRQDFVVERVVRQKRVQE